MRLPFEATDADLVANLNEYVESVFRCLQSEFLVLPKGPGFIEFATFEHGYEALKQGTGSFQDLSAATIERIVLDTPIALIVVRCTSGFTPSEWAYVATRFTGVEISQGAGRSLDRQIRLRPERPLSITSRTTEQRIRALATAYDMLAKGAPPVPAGRLHRLDKADTAQGPISLSALADLGVSYSMLLYERFLGRPFPGHRDSVGELVGDALETAIEAMLSRFGVSMIKTKRAQRVPGFDQAPDFIVPSIHNPQIVIEAKLTEDDETARDKVTRIQHLHRLSLQGQPPDQPRFEVIACIAGRGFGVRRENMRKLLEAARGNVFTLQNLDRLVECTRLREFASRVDTNGRTGT